MVLVPYPWSPRAVRGFIVEYWVVWFGGRALVCAGCAAWLLAALAEIEEG